MYTYVCVYALLGLSDGDGVISVISDRISVISVKNGMISVIVCKKNQKTWLIDTWLMSCRVLGRRVEEAVLQHIITQAAQEKAVSLVGSFIPTARNGIVKDHYKKLGFQRLSVQSNDGSEQWELVIKNYQFKDLPIAF